MIQVHVSQDLQVQVLLPAPNGYYIKNNFNIWRVVRVVEGAALEMLLPTFEPLPKPLDFKGFLDIALSK